MKSCLLPLLAALLLPVAAAAQGSNVTLARAGAWTAYAARSNDGVRLCGMEARGYAGDRQMHIKYFQNGPNLSIQAMRPTWTIPPGTRMPVSFQIDENAPWTANATGGPGAASTSGIVEWVIEGAGIPNFERQFRAGRKLTVAFPGGTEAPWIVSLIGTNAMVNQFVGCMRDLNAGGGVAPTPGPSQPFGGPGPAPGGPQPFVPRAPATPKFPEDGPLPTTR